LKFYMQVRLPFFFYCCTVHSEIRNCSLINKCTMY
jgi:hypothetical protein